jgi:linoleate 10R-lipoxygenase
VAQLHPLLGIQFVVAYTSFREWNPNHDVADAAEKLYGHIDNLELYVGLQAEETKPLIEGAGLCPGKTLSFDPYL